MPYHNLLFGQYSLHLGIKLARGSTPQLAYMNTMRGINQDIIMPLERDVQILKYQWEDQQIVIADYARFMRIFKHKFPQTYEDLVYEYQLTPKV